MDVDASTGGQASASSSRLPNDAKDLRVYTPPNYKECFVQPDVGGRLTPDQKLVNALMTEITIPLRDKSSWCQVDVSSVIEHEEVQRISKDRFLKNELEASSSARLAYVSIMDDCHGCTDVAVMLENHKRITMLLKGGPDASVNAWVRQLLTIRFGTRRLKMPKIAWSKLYMTSRVPFS